MTYVQPTPDQAHLADQIQASQAEQLKYFRMFRDGTIRNHGEYVGNGMVYMRFADDEKPTRETLIQLLMEAMRQLDAAGVPVDGIGVGGLDVI